MRLAHTSLSFSLCNPPGAVILTVGTCSAVEMMPAHAFSLSQGGYNFPGCNAPRKIAKWLRREVTRRESVSRELLLSRRSHSGLNLPPMDHGNGVVAGESLPAMVPDETAIAVPCDLYPAQDVVEDRKHDSSANGKAGEAWTKAQVAKADAVAVEADAKAKAAVAKADAESRVTDAEAAAKVRVTDAEAAAKVRVTDAEAAAKLRVTDAEATTKVRVAATEALKADLKILKLRKEIDVFTGESEVKEYLCVSVSPSVSLSVAHCLFF